MLILTGTIAFFQMTLLPGLLLARGFKLRGGLLEKLIYLFPLSLIFNYLLVFLLVSLKIYLRPVLIALLVCEALAILFLNRRIFAAPIAALPAKLSERFQAEFAPLQTLRRENRTAAEIVKDWIWILAGCGALSAALWGLHVWRLNFGSVFSAWDTLFSWNPYAQSWAANQFPGFNGSYPQLVPANWSLSYVLNGTDAIQRFNTLLPPLFFLWIFLMLLDLGFQRKEAGFFIAAIIARYMMKKIMGDQIFNGYMDVPAAAMVLLTLYTFLKGEGRDARGQRQAILLGCLLAAGTAVTKQAGLIVILAVPLAIHSWLRPGWRTFSRRQRAVIVLAACLIALPWYALAFLHRGDSVEAGNQLIDAGILQFNQRYEGSHKLLLVRKSLGKYLYVILACLLLTPLVRRRDRAPFLIVAGPILLAWGCFFAYDARNIAVALPMVALLAGLGLSHVLEFLTGFLLRSSPGRIPLVFPLLLIIIAIVALMARAYPNERLEAEQFARQHEILGSGLNQELLYDLIGDTHDGSDILTDYPAYYLSGYAECCDMVNFRDTNAFIAKLNNPSIRYLLAPQQVEHLSQEAMDVLQGCLADQRCELLRCSRGYYVPYCLYAVNPP